MHRARPMMFERHELILSVALAAVLVAGCAARPPAPASAQNGPTQGGPAQNVPAQNVPAQNVPAQDGPDLDAAIAQARDQHRLLLVLVSESGRSASDAQALTAVQGAAAATPVVTVLLDLTISRNRAQAARYHPGDAPVLVLQSPQGVMVSRDAGTITEDLVRTRLDEAGPRAARLDSELQARQAACTAHPDDAAQVLALAGFLSAHGNDREAIPWLVAVRSSTTAEPGLRIRAYVAEAQAHVRIGEPEKARHVAKDLLATLGAGDPEARAAAWFALGDQDIKGRHHDLGLQELDQAIAADPTSGYAQSARDDRAKYAPANP